MTEAEESHAVALIDRIQSARKRGRNLRLLLGGLVLAIFVFYGWRIYSTFERFDESAFMTHLNRNAARMVWPAIQSELQRVAREASPVLAKDFAKRVELEWPRFEATLDRQIDQLGKNLRGRTPDVLVAFVDETGKQSGPAIAARFPEVQEKERQDALSAMLTNRMRTWSQHQYGEAVEAHINAMIGIKQTLEAFRADAPGGVRARPEDVLALTLEVLEVRLGGGEPPAAPAAAGKKGGKKGGQR